MEEYELLLRTESNLISLLTNSLGTQAQKGMDGSHLLSWVMVCYCGPYLDHVVEYMSVHTILALCGRTCSVFLLGGFGVLPSVHGFIA
jgi:hypothetical protein